MNHHFALSDLNVEKGTVTSLLWELLGQVPSKVGMRLRSERDLAGMLGVNQYIVRAAFEELLKAGYLVRRHGSGTYVRKVPKGGRSQPDISSSVRETLTSYDLFVSDDENITRRAVVSEQKRLHLDLWSDYHACRGPQIAFTTLKGIEERAAEMGHLLVTHSSVAKIDAPLSAKQIAKQLVGGNRDGFIVVSRWADRFLEGCRLAFGDRLPPIVFIQAYSSSTVDLEPLIQIDVDEACRRAIKFLAIEGFRKIGLVSYFAEYRTVAFQQRLYKRAITDAGLTYQKAQFCEQNPSSEMEAMEKLLDGETRPEAIYVSDDHLIPSVLTALKVRSLQPGKDIGIITLSNVQGMPPGDFDWSRLEFNPELIGRSAVESVVQVIQTAGHEHSSISHQATWRPGATHKRLGRTEESRQRQGRLAQPPSPVNAIPIMQPKAKSSLLGRSVQTRGQHAFFRMEMLGSIAILGLLALLLVSPMCKAMGDAASFSLELSPSIGHRSNANFLIAEHHTKCRSICLLKKWKPTGC